MRSSIAGLLVRSSLFGILWIAVRDEAPPPAQAAQAVTAPQGPMSGATTAAPASVCPEGMVLVDGDYCDEVEQTCLVERPKPHVGCLQYAEPTVCTGAQTHMRFCIDKYEYPNVEGEKPLIMQSWYDADRTCRSIHKRVCRSHEWTLACEGPDRLPYPYGYERDANACHIDELGPMIDEKRFYSPHKEEEIARIDRREPSGSRPDCASAYGVYDLTGNIDEWTTNETGIPDHGSLKGGNWGEWRNACRPHTNGHAAWFRYYQLGFRCCVDPVDDR
jgi:formylglycine-generating enzyme required for sulfatase activity